MKALLTTLILLLAAFASVFPLLLRLRERGVLEPLPQIANRTRAFILVLLISATIFAGNKNVGSGVTNLLGGVRGALSSLMTGGGGTFTADELATGYALSSIGTDETPNRPYVPNGKSVFFLHGFHVTPEVSRGWGSEFFKKLLRSGSRADFWMVTWNGAPRNQVDHYWAANNAFSAATNVLRSTPFFNHNPEGMFTNSIPETLRNHILAKGIPALSQPVERTELPNIIPERHGDERGA